MIANELPELSNAVNKSGNCEAYDELLCELLLRGVNRKAATRERLPVAFFFHRRSYDLADQLLSQLADFRVFGNGCGEWAVLAANKQLTVFLFESSGPTQR